MFQLRRFGETYRATFALEYVESFTLTRITYYTFFAFELRTFAGYIQRLKNVLNIHSKFTIT